MELEQMELNNNINNNDKNYNNILMRFMELEQYRLGNDTSR